MSESRDLLLAAGTVSEAAHNIQRAVNEAKEQTKRLDWAVQRLHEERLAVEQVVDDLRRLREEVSKP